MRPYTSQSLDIARRRRRARICHILAELCANVGCIRSRRGKNRDNVAGEVSQDMLDVKLHLVPHVLVDCVGRGENRRYVAVPEGRDGLLRDLRAGFCLGGARPRVAHCSSRALSWAVLVHALRTDRGIHVNIEQRPTCMYSGASLAAVGAQSS